MDLLIVVDILFGIRIVLDFIFFAFFTLSASWAGWEFYIRKRNGFTKSVMHVAAASAGKFLMAAVSGTLVIFFFQPTSPGIAIIPLILVIIIQIWLGLSYIYLGKELFFTIEEPDEPHKQPDHP